MNAFGIDDDRYEISKGSLTGQPGDKRNTKYVASTAVSPLATVGYAMYRQSDTSKKNRAASIKAKKAKKYGTDDSE